MNELVKGLTQKAEAKMIIQERFEVILHLLDAEQHYGGRRQISLMSRCECEGLREM